MTGEHDHHQYIHLAEEEAEVREAKLLSYTQFKCQHHLVCLEPYSAKEAGHSWKGQTDLDSGVEGTDSPLGSFGLLVLSGKSIFCLYQARVQH